MRRSGLLVAVVSVLASVLVPAGVASADVARPSGSSTLALDVVEAPDGTLGVLVLSVDTVDSARQRLGLMVVEVDGRVRTRMLSRVTDVLSFDLAFSDESGWLLAYTDVESRTRVARFGESRIDEALAPVGGIVRFDNIIDPTQLFVAEVSSEQIFATQWVFDLDASELDLTGRRLFRPPSDVGTARFVTDVLRIADGTLVTLESTFGTDAVAGLARTVDLTVDGTTVSVQFLGRAGDAGYSLQHHWGGYALVYESAEGMSVSPQADPNRWDRTTTVRFDDWQHTAIIGSFTLRAMRLTDLGNSALVAYADLGQQRVNWRTALSPGAIGDPIIMGGRVRGDVVTAITHDAQVIYDEVFVSASPAPAYSPYSGSPSTKAYDSAPVSIGSTRTLFGVTDIEGLWANSEEGGIRVEDRSLPFYVSASCDAYPVPNIAPAAGLPIAVVKSATVRGDGTAAVHVQSSDGEGVYIDEVVTYGALPTTRAAVPSGDYGTWLFGGGDDGTPLLVTANTAGVQATIVSDEGRHRSPTRDLDVRGSSGGARLFLDAEAVHDRWNGYYVLAVHERGFSSRVFVLDHSTGEILRDFHPRGHAFVAADDSSSVVLVATTDVDWPTSYRTYEVNADKSVTNVGSSISAHTADEVWAVPDPERGRFLVFLRSGNTVHIEGVSSSTDDVDSLGALTLPSGLDGPVEVGYSRHSDRGIIVVGGSDRIAILPFGVDGASTECDPTAPTSRPDPIAPLSWGSDDLLTVSDVEILPTGRSGERSGYWLLTNEGQISAFGDAPDLGQQASSGWVDFTAVPNASGYWTLNQDGQVEAFGDAPLLGDLATVGHAGRAVALAATPSGIGYWIFTDEGAAIAFGDAVDFGGVEHLQLAQPIIDAIALADGSGYWMVAADGGVFTFGDAEFLGSVPQILPGRQLNGAVIGLVPTPDGTGYWLVAADGGVFTFNAPFVGSIPGILPRGTDLDGPIVGMVAFGDGYLLVGSDGGVFNFSELPFEGSLGGNGLEGFVAIEPYQTS
ncbi:MAG: hypothetical protein GY925_11845 [Actinomycetia bacterium]|nr:hypothetical protein [Actinomycetes bacterium]